MTRVLLLVARLVMPARDLETLRRYVRRASQER
jgi:hypothetical protein